MLCWLKSCEQLCTFWAAFFLPFVLRKVQAWVQRSSAWRSRWVLTLLAPQAFRMLVVLSLESFCSSPCFMWKLLVYPAKGIALLYIPCFFWGEETCRTAPPNSMPFHWLGKALFPAECSTPAFLQKYKSLVSWYRWFWSAFGLQTFSTTSLAHGYAACTWPASLQMMHEELNWLVYDSHIILHEYMTYFLLSMLICSHLFLIFLGPSGQAEEDTCNFECLYCGNGVVVQPKSRSLISTYFSFFTGCCRYFFQLWLPEALPWQALRFPRFVVLVISFFPKFFDA